MTYDYILVLGGPLLVDKPSPLLRERLDTAKSFYEQNSGVKIIVSGGTKGKKQPYSEAWVMAKYLEENGVSAEDIILEDKAKTTIENFVYTSKLVGESKRVIYVTNEFHIYRSTLAMKKAGVNYTPLGAPDGDSSLSFRIREKFLIPLAKVGLVK